MSTYLHIATPVANVRPLLWRRPNQRLKLTARGLRLVGKASVLITASPGRSLRAIR